MKNNMIIILRRWRNSTVRRRRRRMLLSSSSLSSSTVIILIIIMMMMIILIDVPLSQANTFPKEPETSVRLSPNSNRAKCNVDCSRESTQFVCATDGRTYNNRCELQRVNCEVSSPSSTVQVKHGGRCQEKFRCRAERAHAQEVARGPMTNIFVPQCKQDGSYAQVQCHAATGYCWCATPSGQPIRGSSVRNRRPNCKSWAAMGNRRSNIKRGPVQRRPNNSNNNKQATGSSSSSPTATTDPLIDLPEKRAVDWKFTELDKNGNNFLDKKEVKSLRRMVKKIVKPRECAKRFTKFCDLDRNRHIGRNEWTVCFGMGMNKEQTEEAYGPDDYSTQHHTKEGHLPKNNKQITLTVDDKVGDLEEDDPVNCYGDRQNAQEQQKSSQDTIYVPECGADGKYAQVQCYKSTDYCWCVDEETGKPIPNTSVRNTRPDCEKLIKADRPIKGCPEKKKLKFVTDFTDFLSKEMNAALNQSSLPISTTTEQEQQNLVDEMARWKFENLDTNNNKVLDRKEWRVFRLELKTRNSIRKCGRNFVKFCDDDNDKRITFNEWTECFSVLAERKANMPNRGNKRPSGRNPLITYLKND